MSALSTAEAAAVAAAARPHGSDGTDGDDGATGVAQQFVTFAIGDEMFAVPMAPVQEIIRVPAVARMPLAPPALEGLANLRGRVLPIVNLRRLFNADERGNDDASRALVINLGSPLGFVVDRVASVVSIEPGQMESADGVRSLARAECLTGVIKRPNADGGTELLLVLDFAQLVQAHFAQMQRNASGAAVGAGALDAQAGSTAEAAASDELRLVSFTVAAQEYAIDIADVQEIVQVPAQITALPNAPAHVVGLMSLRQRLLPLVSLRSLFGLPQQALCEQHRIVVISAGHGKDGGQVGLITDAVKEVLSVPAAQAERMPGVLAADGRLQEFASMCRLDGGKRLVAVIATDRLLGLQSMRAASQASQLDAGDDDSQEQQMNSTSNAGNDDLDTQAVIFRLGAEEFGVPIMSVQEIVRVPEALTRVPKTPAFVEGVINLRGTVLPVIDQRARLGLPSIERNDRQRIMVFTLHGRRTGFIVDSVAEVLRVARQQIEPAPALSVEQSQLIRRVANLDGGKRLVMLIDPDQLLGGAEAGAMDAAMDAASESIGTAQHELRRAA
jgi:purine-binding chemotaxis protein CheW